MLNMKKFLILFLFTSLFLGGCKVGFKGNFENENWKPKKGKKPKKGRNNRTSIQMPAFQKV